MKSKKELRDEKEYFEQQQSQDMEEFQSKINEIFSKYKMTQADKDEIIKLCKIIF